MPNIETGRDERKPTPVADLVAAVRRLQREHARPILVALDGRSGVGKSTVATDLVPLIDGRLVYGDDFYAGGNDEEWAVRTPEERRANAFDWERLRIDALEPLLAGRRATWRSFNWQTWEGLSDDTIVCEPAPIIVLDMVYSGGPELAELVDLAVLVTLDDAERRARLIAREGAPRMRRWHALWDSAEEHYFTHVRLPETFDLIVSR